MMRSGLHWLLAMMSGGWLLPPPKSLFDNSPLAGAVSASSSISSGVRRSIAAGQLDALAIVCGRLHQRAFRVILRSASPAAYPGAACAAPVEPAQLSLDHLMASVAVPFLFPPVLMGEEYYGDGAMRQANPFSSAIHLGADRLLVIGTRNESHVVTPQPPLCPTFGQIFGYMLDALFTRWSVLGYGAADADQRASWRRAVRRITTESPLRKIDMLVILPSRDMSEIARHHVGSLPRALARLLRTMGALNTGGGQLMSYLLFQDSFTRELIALGYQDAMKRSEDLLAFIGGFPVASTGATGVLQRLSSRQEHRAESEQ